MKTKKLFLMAAMLLASVCAFAQSVNNVLLRGDVNGDGKIDIADVTELVNIILSYSTTPQNAYYWYVGQTQPTTSTDPATTPGWTQLTYIPSQLHIVSDMSIGIWYVAIPYVYGFQAYDSAGGAVDNVTYNKTQIMIGNVKYDLFTARQTMIKVNGVFKP